MRQPTDIRGIIFDLDGTLYESTMFAETIQDAATEYIAKTLMIGPVAACRKIAETRRSLTEEHHELPTLSAVCSRLGGNIRDLHAFFESFLKPEAYLVKDQRVIALLKNLHVKIPLYLYTNNNRILTNRIVEHLGLNGLFRNIYTIDDTWIAKPDATMLAKILAEAELLPSQALFVGDRYDVDLRLPEQIGCPVYLSKTTEQLLQLGELLQS